MIDASIISFAVSNEEGMTQLLQAGVEQGDFPDQEYQTVWRYLVRMRRDHGEVPSPDTLKTRFPDLELPSVKKRELPILIHNLKQRRRYIELLTALNDAASNAGSFEDVDDVIQNLQGRLNGLSFTGTGRSHLVDLFSEETRERVSEELQRRRSGAVVGFRTGLKRFDEQAGGLQKQKMVTVIGRPGIGKSWLDLLFVAAAVMDGATFILYPLEMTLYETAFRLYTLFSQRMFGADKVIKNYDLTSGKVTKKKLLKFLLTLEDRFPGQLMVADVASLSDPYTVERIEAEVSMHRPDGFWVDYLTLLKPPPGASGDSDWGAVRQLSNGIKNTAMRHNCVGGCSAQVNRQAMQGNIFLPRLEHIAYGDSIGQDADQVFTINRRREFLYYSLVKNRGGMEFGGAKGVKVKFDVNIGLLQEEAVQDPDDEE